MNKVVIVESPGKIKTIQGYLGPSYQVLSSYGHMRDLPKSSFGVDIDNNFAPTYEVDEGKKKQIAVLKKAVVNASLVYLASDDDREGESISWHIKEVLKLPEEKYERIVFQSITKNAIEEALKSPRRLDENLVNAQQARRILDRLVGYKLSPLLWRKIASKLSAGRVQSVAVRLIVEQERAINSFVPISSFKVKALFSLPGEKELHAALTRPFASYDEAKAFLVACQEAIFTITDIKKTKAKKSPLPPLMTSTLQQAAGQELGFSIDETMRCAQKLYEAGKITYMRTDSLSLSKEALKKAKASIIKNYGEEYHKERYYKSKSATAQEAHEAIRPTHFDDEKGSEYYNENRLYSLIRKRTLASQMSDAIIDRTTATIAISTREESLIAKGEIVDFKGFLLAYQPRYKGDEDLLPPLAVDQVLTPLRMHARETFSRPPARYTEATLVQKLDALGIGRPSTYRPIIATIQQRNYVEKASREGKIRPYRSIVLAQGNIVESHEEERIGSEKNKLFPTNTGLVVNDFLMEHFERIMDYGFTADTESELDKIATAKISWAAMLGNFYPPFAASLEKAFNFDQKAEGKAQLVRLLGKDPKSGQPVWARFSRKSGPLVQLGEQTDTTKARFASLRREQLFDQITLEEALDLFQLPREVGLYKGQPILANIGPYGPYLKYEGKFFSLDKEHDPYAIEEKEACEVIEARQDMLTPIKSFQEAPDIEVRKGRFGPYIKTPTKNVKIPKDKDPSSLTLAECQELIAKAPEKAKRGRRRVASRGKKSGK